MKACASKLKSSLKTTASENNGQPNQVGDAVGNQDFDQPSQVGDAIGNQGQWGFVSGTHGTSLICTSAWLRSFATLSE